MKNWIGALVVVLAAASAWAQPGPQGLTSPGREWMQDSDVRESFVKEAKANREVHELLGQYGKAPGKEKDAARIKLEKAVSALFDAELAGKELEIKKMEEQAARIKDQIAKGRQSKEKFVSQRMDQLTGGGGDWEW